jgi:hypothetical protein
VDGEPPVKFWVQLCAFEYKSIRTVFRLFWRCFVLKRYWATLNGLFLCNETQEKERRNVDGIQAFYHLLQCVLWPQMPARPGSVRVRVSAPSPPRAPAMFFFSNLRYNVFRQLGNAATMCLQNLRCSLASHTWLRRLVKDKPRFASVFCPETTLTRFLLGFNRIDKPNSRQQTIAYNCLQVSTRLIFTSEILPCLFSESHYPFF